MPSERGKVAARVMRQKFTEFFELPSRRGCNERKTPSDTGFDRCRSRRAQALTLRRRRKITMWSRSASASHRGW